MFILLIRANIAVESSGRAIAPQSPGKATRLSAATRFSFEPNPARIVFGAGRLDDIADEAERLGISRLLLICSPGRRAAADRAAAVLGRACAGISDAPATNMPAAAFDHAMSMARDGGADGVFSLGGGSPVGLGKAVAHGTGFPHISAPTTYSGSELMGDWRVEGPDGPRGGVDPGARPVTIIYDPELTLDLPPSVSGPSGMNAMAHAVESLYAPNTNPVSSAMGEAGIRALARSLPVVVREPDNLEARGEALRGAWLAGGFRAGSCLEHRIAQSLRRLHGLTHAVSHAVVLPFVVAFNEAAAPEPMARIAASLGSDGAAAGLFRLNDALGIAPDLRSLGMKEADLDPAADIIAERPIPNPRTVTRDGIRAVLDDAYFGRRSR